MNYKEEIKAIVFDFDGTLIDFDYNTTEYTRRALEALKESKYKVCLSSGRPCFLAVKAFEKAFGEYPLDYVFGCNGSEFMDCKANKTEILFPLKAEEVRNIEKIIKADYLVCGIYDDDIFLVNKPCENKALKSWLKARWLTPVLFDFSRNDLERSKVLVLNDPADRQREEEYIASLNLQGYSYAYSSPYCLEFVPDGVSKAKAVEKLSEILECDAKQILSFGDNDNDMPMLLSSTGVIMGNAKESLKEMIPLHTSSVDEMVYMIF
ncbi:MAG: HAD family hydrolase [Erysipelotrichaceae bacterium]|nr:HAD family hydrolase [Erysipelotrichaceae bacterium]